jgi:sugar phosphate isomerase/epimerase
MFVACSTLCFSHEPLEAALRHIAELEFSKVDLALREDLEGHLRPSEVLADPEAAVRRLRRGPSLTFSALDLDFGDVDAATHRKWFDASCRLAKLLTVAVLTIPASPLGTPLDAEIARLSTLSALATREGLVLTVASNAQTLTSTPATALQLCQAVPGLALTLDPSPYLIDPAQPSFDELLPYTQNVHLRDTGKTPDEFQVRVGQGRIDYARIVNLLERQNYSRALTVAFHHRADSPFDTEVEVRKLQRLLESLL